MHRDFFFFFDFEACMENWKLQMNVRKERGEEREIEEKLAGKMALFFFFFGFG